MTKTIRSLTCAMILSGGALLASSQAAIAKEPIRNIVLVHGAWVDGSGWQGVYERLKRDGYAVTMVQEPLTSLDDDVAATKRILDMQNGPTILVGHSYGGSIITQAGVHPAVVGLVYVAAHAPDVGEDESTLGKKMPSVTSKIAGAIKTTPDDFTYLDRSLFPTHFAGGLAPEKAQFQAQSEVLTAAKVFSQPLTQAAWRTKPSWGIVAESDEIINPDLERFYYKRAKSVVTMVPGASHGVFETRPDIVAKVIEDAAQHAGDPR